MQKWDIQGYTLHGHVFVMINIRLILCITFSVICVQPKLSSQNRRKHGVKDTKDAVLMMKDGCHRFGNFILWQLCKKPGINNHILSEIPIFDEGSHDRIPFRNIFCAECSKSNNEASYTYWHVSIRCGGTITFNYENLLHFVQEENCEIYFKPPFFRYATPCDYSSDFTVSSCNVTGLWKEYDNGICGQMIFIFFFFYSGQIAL